MQVVGGSIDGGSDLNESVDDEETVDNDESVDDDDLFDNDESVDDDDLFDDDDSFDNDESVDDDELRANGSNDFIMYSLNNLSFAFAGGVLLISGLMRHESSSKTKGGKIPNSFFFCEKNHIYYNRKYICLMLYFHFFHCKFANYILTPYFYTPSLN